MPRTLSTALAAGLTLSCALAGCGQAQARVPRLSARPPAQLAAVGHDRSPSRRELARRDAALLLSSVRLPPGAQPSAVEPSGDGHLLSAPAGTIGDPDLVDLHRYFVVPAGPLVAQAYVQHHVPAGAASEGYGSANTRGTTEEWFASDSWPSVRTLLDQRMLVISIAALARGRSAIRVDAQVTWLPAKPTGDLVPAGATVLTAVLSRGLNPGERGFGPVTTTGPARIEAIRAFVDRLGVYPPGMVSCPAGFGQYLTISFRKGADARPFAVVVGDAAGCEGVRVQHFGHVAKPWLAGSGLVQFVERELGLTARPRAPLGRAGSSPAATS